jgi:hypothetical protein
MQEAARLRELEAECRQHALDEPERKWYWLAQAAKYQVLADQQNRLSIRTIRNRRLSGSRTGSMAEWSR